MQKNNKFVKLIMSNKSVENRENPEKEKPENEVEGVVVETLPNLMFKIRLDDGEEVLSILSGKMRYHRIRILMGDKVSILLDPYGGKARIVRRL